MALMWSKYFNAGIRLIWETLYKAAPLIDWYLFFADVFSHMQVDILLFQLSLLDSQFAKKNELHYRKNSLPDISTCKYMHCSSRVRPAKVHRILDGSRLTPRTHPSRIQITEQDVQRASFCLWDPPLLNWFVTVSLIAVAHQHPWHRCAWST